MSLPKRELTEVNWVPVSCMPSPESPAKRMTTRSSSVVGMSCRGGHTSSVSAPPVVPRGSGRHREFGPSVAVKTAPGTSIVPTRAALAASPERLGARQAPVGLMAPAQAIGDRGVEEDVLDGVEELDAFGHRALEGLAADDQPGPAGPLVDDGGADGLGQVVGALGLAAGVDEGDPARVAVDDLPAGEVDGVVGGELLVDERVGLAELERGVATVVLGLLLLDDVGLDGDAHVVGLAGEVGRQVVVGLLGLEGRVAEVAPEDGEEPEGVGLRRRPCGPPGSDGRTLSEPK